MNNYLSKFWVAAITACGLGAIGAFVFWSLYKQWLSLPIFSKLTPSHSFIIMLVFLVLTFLSLVGMLLAYVFLKLHHKKQEDGQIQKYESFNKIKENIKPSKIKGAYLFTNKVEIDRFRSHSLLNTTYGTFNTEDRVPHQNLLNEIKQKIEQNNFFLIYGNSGRGKTFFVFDLIESLIGEYNVVYYSPNFNYRTNQRTDFVESILNYIHSSGKKLLFVMDDSHLGDKQLKLDLLARNDMNLYLLVVSRTREKDFISHYNENSLFKPFNQIAEQTFNELLKMFCSKHNITLDKKLRDSIEDEIEGANLVFLTLILQSWNELLQLKSNKNISLKEIYENAKLKFIDRYKERSPEWRDINHIVSAFFQYEIKIDQRYLSYQNEYLNKKGLQEYLKDRMIIDREFYEENKLRMFYVFMDFTKGEESYMMRHAAEFRFYLKAYNGYLSFNNKSALEKEEYTTLVLQDYIKFKPKPKNVGEIQFLITQNADKKEAKIIISELLKDKEIIAIFNEEDANLMNNMLTQFNE